MSTNLRLRPDAEEAVRAEAARTGRPQQEIIRKAVDRYLGLGRPDGPSNDAENLVASGRVLPARTEFEIVHDLVALPDGVDTAGLLDRDERF